MEKGLALEALQCSQATCRGLTQQLSGMRKSECESKCILGENLHQDPGLSGLIITLTLNWSSGRVYFSPPPAEGQTEERSFWASRKGSSVPSSACNSDLILEVRGTVRRSEIIKEQAPTQETNTFIANSNYKCSKQLCTVSLRALSAGRVHSLYLQ